MQCPHCKTEIRDGQARCYDCGRSLVDAGAAGSTQAEPRPAYARTAAQERRTNLIVNILIGLFVLVIALVIIGAIFIRVFPRMLRKELKHGMETSGCVHAGPVAAHAHRPQAVV